MRWKWWLCPLPISAGSANSAYWEWCRHRISNEVLLRDDEWPRPWHYPDRWLARWQDQVNGRIRAETGAISFHGAWDRLRPTPVLGHPGSMLVGWPGVVLFAARPRSTPDYPPQQTAGA